MHNKHNLKYKTAVTNEKHSIGLYPNSNGIEVRRPITPLKGPLCVISPVAH